MKTKLILALAPLALFFASPTIAQVLTSGTNISVGTSTISGTQDTENSRALSITGTVDFTQTGVTTSASGNFSLADLQTSYNNDVDLELFADSDVTPTLGVPGGQAQSSTTFEELIGVNLDYTLAQDSSSTVTGGAFSTTSTTNSVSVFGGI